jgi:hypothetical protein
VGSVLGLLVAGACTSFPGGLHGTCGDAAVCPEDASLYAQPCTGKVVAALPAGDCPALDCMGRVAYAVCNGADWASCACHIPPGYSLVDAGFFGPEGGAEEGGIEADAAGDASTAKDAEPDRR